MKNHKRILAALVACLLCMTALLPWASAEIIFLPQASDIISSAYVSPAPKGGGLIETTATIVCAFPVDSLGFTYIRLQENQNGTWVTVKSVTSKYDSNTTSYQYAFTYYGTPGMSYRATAGFYARDGVTTETRSGTSAAVTCR
jgi:hypothetical protein